MFKDTARSVRKFLKIHDVPPGDLILVRQNYANSPIYKEHTFGETKVRIEDFLNTFVTFLKAS